MQSNERARGNDDNTHTDKHNAVFESHVRFELSSRGLSVTPLNHRFTPCALCDTESVACVRKSAFTCAHTLPIEVEIDSAHASRRHSVTQAHNRTRRAFAAALLRRRSVHISNIMRHNNTLARVTSTTLRALPPWSARLVNNSLARRVCKRRTFEVKQSSPICDAHACAF